MQTKPLKSYRTPAYPDKNIFLRNPGIMRTLPERWKGNARIGIAVSFFSMLMLTGCLQKIDDNDEAVPKVREGVELSVIQNDTPGLIAPIFKHGDGRGSFGCVSVAPPTFLSEAEAFEVISEEAKKEGIIFKEDALKLDGVDIPITSLKYDTGENNTKNLKSKKGRLAMDGFDVNMKIAFEFVSKDDVVEWKGDEGVYSTVESYDALSSAEKLKDGLDGRNEGNTVALFYDPMDFEKEMHDKYQKKLNEISTNDKLSDDEKNEKWRDTFQKYEDELKELKLTQLKEQVKDFIGWLKAQGII